MDNVSLHASSQFGQLPVVPQVPAERARLHLGDVNSQPGIGIEARILDQSTLPRRYDKMHSGNLLQLQKASHDIKGVALQPGDLRGEGGGSDENLHSFDTSLTG